MLSDLSNSTLSLSSLLPEEVELSACGVRDSIGGPLGSKTSSFFGVDSKEENGDREGSRGLGNSPGDPKEDGSVMSTIAMVLEGGAREGPAI